MVLRNKRHAEQQPIHIRTSALLVTKMLVPSFISHPNGMVLRVLKKSYTPSLLETKYILGPRFICHLNGIVLRVLNQQQSRLHVLKRKRSTPSSPSLSSSAAAAAAASMVKMKTETD